MEDEGSLPHLQVPTTCPYPEPDRSSLCPHTPLPKEPSLILTSHLCLGPPIGLFPQVSPLKPSMQLSPLCATCPTNLICNRTHFITNILHCIKMKTAAVYTLTSLQLTKSLTNELHATFFFVFKT